MSANPNLTSDDVKAVLRDSGEKIDIQSGSYDEHGHSPLYGYGRPDVARAVQLAQQRSLFAEVRDERFCAADNPNAPFTHRTSGRSDSYSRSGKAGSFALGTRASDNDCPPTND